MATNLVFYDLLLNYPTSPILLMMIQKYFLTRSRPQPMTKYTQSDAPHKIITLSYYSKSHKCNYPPSPSPMQFGKEE